VTWALIAIIVVCVAALGLVIRHDAIAATSVRASEARAAEATQRADQVAQQSAGAVDRIREAEARALGEHERAVAAEERAKEAEARLTYAHQTTEALTEMVAAPAVGHLRTLWALALLEQDRTWRLTMALPSGTDEHRTRTLADALEGEISRIREETGTPGTLVVDLRREPEPGDAVMVLRSIQGLLALLTRHSQAFDLHVGTAANRVVTTVVCEDFDGPDTVADEATALLEALRHSGGELTIDRSDDGRLRARMQFPTG
jgi:hypothetical protein